MNNFVVDILKKRNIQDSIISSLDTVIDFNYPKFKNLQEGCNLLIQAVLKGYITCIFYDIDMDGLAAGHVSEVYIKKLGGKTTHYINKTKKHGLTPDLLEYCISSNVKLLVAVDSSSNDLELQNRFIEEGIQVLILDHHIIETNISTEPTESKVIISCKNSIDDRDFSCISGALVVYFFNQFCEKHLSGTSYTKNFDLACITLYSDFCSLKNQINRSVLDAFFKLPSYSTKLSLLCTGDIKKVNKNTVITASTVNFSIVPLFNALIRTGKSTIAVEMINTVSNSEYINYLNIAKQQVALQADIVEILLEGIDKEILDMHNFCIANMSRVLVPDHEDIKLNFTGLIATRVRDKVSKPVFILYEHSTMYKGSFRGTSQVNYKDIICDCSAIARGHELACGVFIEKSDFLTALGLLKKNMPVFETPIEYDIDVSVHKISCLYDSIIACAEFNEMAGSVIQKIRFKLSSNCDSLSVVDKTEKYSIINFDGILIKAFGLSRKKIVSKDNMIVTPVIEYTRDNVRTYSLVYAL